MWIVIKHDRMYITENQVYLRDDTYLVEILHKNGKIESIIVRGRDLIKLDDDRFIKAIFDSIYNNRSCKIKGVSSTGLDTYINIDLHGVVYKYRPYEGTASTTFYVDANIYKYTTRVTFEVSDSDSLYIGKQIRNRYDSESRTNAQELSELQKKILKDISSHPATAEDLYRKYHMNPTTVAARISELRKGGHICAIGTKKGTSNISCIIWGNILDDKCRKRPENVHITNPSDWKKC